MIITEKMLAAFSACDDTTPLLEDAYPKGFDISPLWGSDDDARAFWEEVLIFHPLVRENLGWCWKFGLLPNIRDDLRLLLEGEDLTYSDLRYALLSNCAFPKYDLRRSMFTYAWLREANFHEANLTSCTFRHTYARRMHAGQARLCRAYFDRAELNFASFRRANLAKAKFVGCDLENADFREANLEDCKFENCDLSHALFDRATGLKHKNIDNNLNLTMASFKDAIISR